MTAIGLVAEREFTVRVKSTAYRAATILGPLVAIALAYLPQVLLRADRDPVSIAIVDETGQMAADLARALERTGRYAVVAPLAGGERGARRALDSGRIAGYLVVPRDVGSGASPAFYGRTVADSRSSRALADVVSSEVTRQRLASEGLDVERVRNLSRPVALQAYRVDARATSPATADRSGMALGFVLVLYFMILLYGMSIMTSVTEEKANRSAELLFSSVRPFDLMAGKLIGVGGAGLLQYVAWNGAGLLVLRFGPGGGVLDLLSEVRPGVWVAFLGFFCAGFLLFGTLYLAMGALASSNEEAQQMNLPVTAFAVLAFLLAIYVLDHPDTPLSAALSLVPLFAPMLLFSRIVVSDVPAWQLATGTALLAAAIVLGLVLAGRIYRAAMLLQGRRPTLREIGGWLRGS